nr:hypothetical protein [Tanacetum cinerariifolium]
MQHRPISSRKLNDKEEWTTKDIQCQLPPKELNLGNFTLPCTIGNFNFYGMADLGASVNVMPRNTFEYLGVSIDPKPDRTGPRPNWSRTPDRGPDRNAKEYELGIGKKGHMLYKIWEYCKDVHRDNTYWWHDHGFEKEECDEMEIEVEKYDPPAVQVETFE